MRINSPEFRQGRTLFPTQLVMALFDSGHYGDLAGFDEGGGINVRNHWLFIGEDGRLSWSRYSLPDEDSVWIERGSPEEAEEPLMVKVREVIENSQVYKDLIDSLKSGESFLVASRTAIKKVLDYAE